MKNLLAILVLLISTTSFAANSDGSGNTPEAIYQTCMSMIDANSDGSGTTDANSDGSGTTDANSDGSGTTDANSDGSGTFNAAFNQCMNDLS